MNQQIEQDFARIFLTVSGKNVIKYLRSITLERALGSGVTDAELRFLEGQRFLVRQIENLTERGKQQKGESHE